MSNSAKSSDALNADRSGTDEPRSVEPVTNTQVFTWIVVTVIALVGFMLRAAIRSGLWNEFVISATHVVVVGLGLSFLLREKFARSTQR